MGKKKIAQLLEQLQENQQQELQNAAAIYTVAQVAVNQLQAQFPDAVVEETKALPAGLNPTAALPPAPRSIDQAELKKRYGSHVACRQAAKQLGIKFRKNPTWEQLTVAFSYFEACQNLITEYLQTHPNQNLQGITIELKLG